MFVTSWTLAFLTVSRWLTQQTLQDGKIITQWSGLLASGLPQSAGVCIAVVTHAIAQRLPVCLRVGLVAAPWPQHERAAAQSPPLLGRFVRWPPHVSHTSMLVDRDVIDLNGPALWRDAQDGRCR